MVWDCPPGTESICCPGRMASHCQQCGGRGRRGQGVRVLEAETAGGRTGGWVDRGPARGLPCLVTEAVRLTVRCDGRLQRGQRSRRGLAGSWVSGKGVRESFREPRPRTGRDSGHRSDELQVPPCRGACLSPAELSTVLQDRPGRSGAHRLSPSQPQVRWGSRPARLLEHPTPPSGDAEGLCPSPPSLSLATARPSAPPRCLLPTLCHHDSGCPEEKLTATSTLADGRSSFLDLHTLLSLGHPFPVGGLHHVPREPSGPSTTWFLLPRRTQRGAVTPGGRTGEGPLLLLERGGAAA